MLISSVHPNIWCWTSKLPWPQGATVLPLPQLHREHKGQHSFLLQSFKNITQARDLITSPFSYSTSSNHSSTILMKFVFLKNQHLPCGPPTVSQHSSLFIKLIKIYCGVFPSRKEWDTLTTAIKFFNIDCPQKYSIAAAEASLKNYHGDFLPKHYLPKLCICIALTSTVHPDHKARHISSSSVSSDHKTPRVNSFAKVTYENDDSHQKHSQHFSKDSAAGGSSSLAFEYFSTPIFPYKHH